MIFSIGTDCEEIGRFQKVLDSPELLNRIFTEKEIEYSFGKPDPKKHLAVRFAGKEALIKAFSDLDIQISMGYIEIINSPGGVPKANIKGVSGYNIKISLSHCGDIAVAHAMVMKE